MDTSRLRRQTHLNSPGRGDRDLGFSTSRRRSEFLDGRDDVKTLDNFTYKRVDLQMRTDHLMHDDVPNTTCLPSSQEVTTVVMKNWEPLVFLPELAMESNPALVCFNLKFSSTYPSEIRMMISLNAGASAPSNFVP